MCEAMQDVDASSIFYVLRRSAPEHTFCTVSKTAVKRRRDPEGIQYVVIIKNFYKVDTLRAYMGSAVEKLPHTFTQHPLKIRAPGKGNDRLGRQLLSAACWEFRV